MEQRLLFDIERIAESLQGFQDAFPALNAQLKIHRETFEDSMRENILAAYRYLNELLAKGIALFSPAGLHCMLELNHVVLCGTDPDTRYEYHSHILQTRRRYQENIRPIRKWVEAHARTLEPFDLAAGFYIRSLSQPQLFLEGNHRTENIILNYLLLSREMSPYIITAATAVPYLNLSGEIKFSQRRSLAGQLVRLARRKRQFSAFVRQHADGAYVTEESCTS